VDAVRIGAYPAYLIVSRSIVGLCTAFGFIVGGYIPAVWGAAFSVSTIFFSLLGGVAGLWLGIRLSDE
jgi:hypothetical protein